MVEGPKWLSINSEAQGKFREGTVLKVLDNAHLKYKFLKDISLPIQVSGEREH